MTPPSRGGPGRSLGGVSRALPGEGWVALINWGEFIRLGFYMWYVGFVVGARGLQCLKLRAANMTL